MPKFQKEFPKNAKQYVDPSFDEAYKKKHPVGYWILVACGIGVLILPLIIWILVTGIWYPAPNSGFSVMAIAGCFIIGIGFFNIVAAFIGQYLGHWVTAGCLFLGSVLVSISLFIMYKPNVYALFDEYMVTYYFVTILFLVVLLIFYVSFRYGVDSWLRNKRVAKGTIKKLKKGKKNFWWYEALNATVGMGLIYHINKLFTILYLLELALALLFGWLRFMVPVITVLYVVISIIIAVMLLFSAVQKNIDAYGTPVILLRRNERGGFDSSILDLGLMVFPLGIAYAHILVMLDAIKLS